jgi:hypothetical protein
VRSDFEGVVSIISVAGELDIATGPQLQSELDLVFDAGLLGGWASRSCAPTVGFVASSALHPPGWPFYCLKASYPQASATRSAPIARSGSTWT